MTYIILVLIMVISNLQPHYDTPEEALATARQSGAHVKRIEYRMLPTLRQFHESPAQIRCVVGPVGSGKTTAAAWDVCCYRPYFLQKRYGINKTRGVIVRNTYTELIDTTQATVFDWFPWGDLQVQRNIYTLKWPNGGPEIEILFRSCDRLDDIKKFKSLEITWYWGDESIEIPGEAKRMLKGRIGRYPRKCPVRYGIETTNPPDVEMDTYTQFDWQSPPPGPIPSGTPLKNHAGFWQPPRENEQNLRYGYYNDLLADYADNPDWGEMYVDGKPGVIVRGKLVYNNFVRKVHVSPVPLKWSGGTIIRGWDNSGNCPACIPVQVPTAGQAQFLPGYTTDREGIVDFTRRVVTDCNIRYPGASFVDWADPAGANTYSKPGGGFTSNAELMKLECGVEVKSSEQNVRARIESIEQALGRRNGVLIDPDNTRFINGFLGGYSCKQLANGEYAEQPEKTRFAHIQEAAQYAMVKLFSFRDKGPPRPKPTPRRYMEQQAHGWMG